MSRLLAATLLATLAAEAASQEHNVERGLIDALRLKKGTIERVGDSGAAIRAYMQAGLIHNRPDQRADYTDYYLLNKPAKFMGHELLVIEEEYMSRYVGCCVSPGAGVSVKVLGDTRKLEAFAQANKCTLSKHVDLQKELRGVGIRTTLPGGNFASLSCRERDANR